MRSLTFLVFVFLTFCCWGLYGPTLHVGQVNMGEPGNLSSLRPFICVGIAYFLIAVLFPVIVLGVKGEKGHWSIGGFIWSFLGGAVGAVGALGIIFAFKFGGKPVYVMPLVFGCAPIVNTLVTMAMSRTFKQASAIFYVGILLVALGAAGVLIFKPVAHNKVAHKQADSAQLKVSSESVIQPVAFLQDVGQDEDGANPVTAGEEKDSDDNAVEEVAPSNTDAIPATQNVADVPAIDPKPTGDFFYIALSILVSALCWGAYGPVLHKGQAKMAGSRLRPFFCVGLAYFAIAVVVPWLALPYFNEPGAFDTAHTTGILWSMLAGAAGAGGALGIIYAFNAGGKPIFVMPLIFGMAPLVNTFVEVVTKGLAGTIQPWFYVSLAMVIAGAVTVLIFAPRGAPKPALK